MSDRPIGSIALENPDHRRRVLTPNSTSRKQIHSHPMKTHLDEEAGWKRGSGSGRPIICYVLIVQTWRSVCQSLWDSVYLSLKSTQIVFRWQCGFQGEMKSPCVALSITPSIEQFLTKCEPLCVCYWGLVDKRSMHCYEVCFCSRGWRRRQAVQSWK